MHLVEFRPNHLTTCSHCEMGGMNERWLAHVEEGRTLPQHPIHYKCLRAAFANLQACGICRREIELQSLNVKEITDLALANAVSSSILAALVYKMAIALFQLKPKVASDDYMLTAGVNAVMTVALTTGLAFGRAVLSSRRPLQLMDAMQHKAHSGLISFGSTYVTLFCLAHNFDMPQRAAIPVSLFASSLMLGMVALSRDWKSAGMAVSAFAAITLTNVAFAYYAVSRDMEDSINGVLYMNAALAIYSYLPYTRDFENLCISAVNLGKHYKNS